MESFFFKTRQQYAICRTIAPAVALYSTRMNLQCIMMCGHDPLSMMLLSTGLYTDRFPQGKLPRKKQSMGMMLKISRQFDEFFYRQGFDRASAAMLDKQ